MTVIWTTFTLDDDLAQLAPSADPNLDCRPVVADTDLVTEPSPP